MHSTYPAYTVQVGLPFTIRHTERIVCAMPRRFATVHHAECLLGGLTTNERTIGRIAEPKEVF